MTMENLWRAIPGGTFYCVENHNGFLRAGWGIDNRDSWAENNYKMGNYFRTIDEAAEAVRKIRKIFDRKD